MSTPHPPVVRLGGPFGSPICDDQPESIWLQDALQKKRLAGRTYFGPVPGVPAQFWSAQSQTLAWTYKVTWFQKSHPEGEFPRSFVMTPPAHFAEVQRRASESPQPANNHVDAQVLQQRVRFLEAQLEADRPYLRLYRLGAGSLFVAILSLVVWLLTGAGMPFHPIFAAVVIPAAMGIIGMAFLLRTSKSE